MTIVQQLAPDLGRHALNIFPPMSQERIEAVAKDIEMHGLREPIVLFEGEILDGWARYLACLIAGIEPRFETYTGDAPLDFVLSRNASRRHLTTSQKALVAAKLVIEVFEKRARCRMLVGKADPSLTGGEGGKAAAQAAKLIGIGRATVERALKVIRGGEAGLVSAMESGEIKVSVAARICDLPADSVNAFVRMGRESRKSFIRKMEAEGKAAKETAKLEKEIASGQRHLAESGAGTSGAIVKRDQSPWFNGGGADQEFRFQVLLDGPAEKYDLMLAFARAHGFTYRVVFAPLHRDPQPAAPEDHDGEVREVHAIRVETTPRPRPTPQRPRAHDGASTRAA